MKKFRPRKIALLVVSFNHTILIDHLCHLFAQPEFELTIFSSKSFFELLSSEKKLFFRNAKWIYMDFSDVNAELHRVLPQINDNDLIIIPTLRSFHKLLSKIHFEPPILLFIHNFNYWFASKNRASVTEIRGLINKFHFLINSKKNRFLEEDRKLFLNQVKIVNFHNPSTDKLLNNRLLITHIPFTYYIPEMLPRPNRKNDVRYTIPGEIVELRKDYDVIYNAFNNIRHNFKTQSSLHFLGRFNCSGRFKKNLCQKFHKIETETFKVIFYDEFSKSNPGSMLPDDLFSRIMIDTTVAISAQRKNAIKIFKGYQEIFGQTASSGLSFDMIRFKTPGIFGSSHEVLPVLGSIVDTYTSLPEFQQLLLKYQDPRYALSKKNQISKISRKFTRKYLIKEFLSDLNKNYAN